MQSEALATVIIAARYGVYERRGDFLTINHVIYSYGVELARYDKESKRYIGSSNLLRKYSVTTSKHQNVLIQLIDQLDQREKDQA